MIHLFAFFIGCLNAEGMLGLEIAFHSNSVESYVGKQSAFWKGIDIKRQGMMW